QWKQVILLWVGREDVEKEGFIRALVEFEDGCGGFYQTICSVTANLLLSQKLENKNIDKNLLEKFKNEDLYYIRALPYHLVSAEMLAETYELMTDIDFIYFYNLTNKRNNYFLWSDHLFFLLSEGIFSARSLYLLGRLKPSLKKNTFIRYLSVYFRGKQQDNVINVVKSTIALQSIKDNNILFGIVFCLKIFWRNNTKRNPVESFGMESFDFDNAVCTVVRHCAENLPYPEFYQAWHHPPTTPHPEVTEQTQVGHNSTVDSLETQQIDICHQLQHLPMYCLNADILTDKTDPSEIAQTLCQLIWEEAFPDEDCPKEVTTPSKLGEHLKTLKLRQNLPNLPKLPKLPILITHCHPNTELIAFCRKLTSIVTIAFLTDEALEAPLEGFPPNQPNLISAIEAWLEQQFSFWPKTTRVHNRDW
ncbi:MAG: hypothetical protein ACRCU2_32065, partial [Planktothrix sp.]